MKVVKIKLDKNKKKSENGVCLVSSPPPAPSATELDPPVSYFLRQLTGLDQAGLEAALLSGVPLPYAEDAIARRLGWEKGSFNAALLKDLASPNSLRILNREFEQQGQGVFNPYTLSFTDADGAPVDFLVIPRPFGNGSVVSLASAPKNAELAALKPVSAKTGEKGTEKYDLPRILDFFPGYIVIIDKNHRIRFENKVFRQIFGSGGGQPCHKVLRGQDAPCRNCPPFSVLASNNLCISEWLSGKAGQAFRVYSYPFEDADGSRMVLKVGIDITAGVKARQALDLSEQRYTSITDNLTLGISVVDENLQLSQVNTQIKRWFPEAEKEGVTLCSLLNRACSRNGDCSHCPAKASFADGANHEHELVMQAAVAPSEGKQPRKRAQTPQERYYRLFACPVKHKSGKVRAVIILLEDITVRRQMMRRLQRAQQVEAMATLAGGIAHEINQPLSALHLYAGGLQMLLEKQENLPANVTRERLGLIMNQADRIREIISSMRSLAMQEDAPKAAPTSVAEAMEGALSLLGSQLKNHGISVRFVPNPALPKVMAVKVQLEQVFINLLANAMHALDSMPNMPEGRDKEIRVSTTNIAARGLVQIEIADTGPGIPDSIADRLFDPFFTTNEGHKGMGLGLSIVHTFVHAWGGEVVARKKHRELGGAAFYLLLPAAGRGAVASDEERNEPAWND